MTPMKKIYAASMAVFGSYMTPNLAAAFRHSKLHNIEVVMSAIVGDSPEAVENRNLLYELKQEGVLKFVSSHIPYGSLWDPACLDETERKKISARIRNLLLEYPDFVAPDLTLHAGTEPTAPHEREARISQACRTIEELLPTVEQINSRINVELLPRSCPCNCEEELLKVVQTFNTPRLGINFDLNHIMDRYREIPDLIELFSPWLNACHVNDYDGVDEQHWRPGNGLQDWQ